MRLGKKFLSVFLSIVLVVGLCPGLAYADEGGAAISKTANGTNTTANVLPLEAEVDANAIPECVLDEGVAHADRRLAPMAATFVDDGDGRRPDLGFSGADGVGVSAQASDIASGDCGTCVWAIDSEGKLTIRPKVGAYGELGESFPWGSYGDKVTSVSVVETVKAGESCSSMFSGLSAATDMQLSGLDTSAATQMRYMFYGCSSLGELDLSSFQTPALESMQAMFAGCGALERLDVSGFDTSSVHTLNQAFMGCAKLRSLDLSSFDTSRVTSIMGAFSGCSALETINVGADWRLSAQGVSDSDFAFQDCPSLIGGNGTRFDVAHTGSDYARVDADGQPGYLTLSEADNASRSSGTAKAASGEFGGCTWSVDVSGKLTIAPTDGVSGTLKQREGEFVLEPSPADFYPWYAHKGTITDIIVAPGVKAVGDIQGIFSGYTLNTLDINSMDTSEVTSMTEMFGYTTVRKHKPCFTFDTSNVQYMGSMFAWSDFEMGWSANWDTSKVEFMGHMLYEAKGGDVVTLSFDASSLRRAPQMFFKSSYATLDVSKVANMTVSENSLWFQGAGTEEFVYGGNFSLSSLIVLPFSRDSQTNWWSMAERKWLSADEIRASRSGIVDTYCSVQSDAPWSAETVLADDGKGLTFDISPAQDVQAEDEAKDAPGKETVPNDEFGPSDASSNTNSPALGEAGRIGSVNTAGTLNVVPVVKSANTMKVKAKAVIAKAGKKQSFKASKAFKVSDAQGKVTYEVSKYDKRAKKKIAVSKSGKVTVKKGLAKGAYKLKVKVTAAGNYAYASATKTATLKVQVK